MREEQSFLRVRIAAAAAASVAPMIRRAMYDGENGGSCRQREYGAEQRLAVLLGGKALVLEQHEVGALEAVNAAQKEMARLKAAERLIFAKSECDARIAPAELCNKCRGGGSVIGDGYGIAEQRDLHVTLVSRAQPLMQLVQPRRIADGCLLLHAAR